MPDNLSKRGPQDRSRGVGKRSSRRGIEFLVNEAGDRKAVVIDLAKYGELWEDFYDTLLAKEREHEPRETLAEVKTKLGISGD
jgi:hypothetical protein